MDLRALAPATTAQKDDDFMGKNKYPTNQKYIIPQINN
jgi:hypothetical protein